MKALNRAIARTVSQLARHGAEGCHPPMLMALENHLDALLTMERKQLEQVPGKLVAFSISVPPVKWTPEMVAAFNRMEPEQLRTESIITGGKRMGKSEVDKLLRTPVEKWTSDQLKWFKANVVLSITQLDQLDARWKAANTQAETATGEAANALDKACEAASNFASEGARYLLQLNEAMTALEAIANPHILPSNGDPVVLREYARKAFDSIKGSAASDKPVQWYQHGVHGIGDPGLQWTPSAASEQPVPPAPDVIDMTDPRNWQEGDVVRRKCDGSVHFAKGNQYRVNANDNLRVHIEFEPGESVSYPHGTPFDGAEHYFTWLRHSEAQQ